MRILTGIKNLKRFKDNTRELIKNFGMFKAEVETGSGGLRMIEDTLDKYAVEQFNRWEVNFHSQGGVYGHWAGLAERTLNDREKKGYGGKPMLVRTGSLFAHFTDIGTTPEKSNNTVTWNVRDIDGAYPITMQTGLPNPQARNLPMPNRILFDLDEKDEGNLAIEFERELDAIIGRYFS